MFPPAKSVSGALALLAQQAALRRGMGPREFQRLTGIADGEARVDARIPAHKHLAMLNLTEPDWSVRSPFEEILQVPDGAPFGTLFGLVSNAPDLQTVFAQFLRFRVLLGNVDDLTLRRTDDDFEFDYVLEGPQRNAISAFGNLAMLWRLACQYGVGPRANATLDLTGSAFAPAAPLEAFVGGAVRFGQARNVLRFTAPQADRPYERHNAVSYRFLCRQAEAELDQLQSRDSFAARIERHLAQTLQAAGAAEATAATLDDLCERLSISRSTLHRRLQKEGTHFQALLAQARLAEARRLLREPRLSITDVSGLLGFASLSAFSHFFSDREGVSPSRYQLVHRAV